MLSNRPVIKQNCIILCSEFGKLTICDECGAGDEYECRDSFTVVVAERYINDVLGFLIINLTKWKRRV